MLRKYARRSAFVCVSALAVIASLPSMRAKVMPQGHDRLTPQQILQIAQPICNAIAPRSGCVTMTVEPSTTGGFLSAEQPLWLVDGKDKRGEVVTHLIYDAKTGELISAGRLLRRTTVSAQAMLDRQEAERSGRSWLQILGIARPGSNWRLVQVKKWRGGNWSLSWKSGTRLAYAILEGHSGEFLVGGCNHLQPTVLTASSAY